MKITRAITLLLVACAATVAGQVPKVFELTTEPQLFVDDFLIESKESVFRTLHNPERVAANPVIVPDRPWEGYLAMQPGTVIFDKEDGVFKMWYNSLATREHPSVEQYLCYATSRDGLRWEKPNLGLVEFQGSKANNIILKWSNWTHSVIRDAGDRPERRYKLAYWQTEDKKRCGVWAAFSPDGIRWTDYEANPVVPCSASGDTFSVMQEPTTGRFLLYHKTAFRPVRKVSRMWSDDFIQWRDSRQVLEPDELDQPDTEFYGLSAFPYGGQYLGMLWIFHQYSQLMDVQFTSSRDGLKWDRTRGRQRFMPLGFMKLEYGGASFDSGMIYPASAPVEKDGSLWIYYSGFANVHSAPSLDHTGKIGLAKLRLDGFSSMDAASEGYFVTRPLRFQGSELTLNAEIRRLHSPEEKPNSLWSTLFSGSPDGVGSIRVEVQDEAGKVIPGYEASRSQPMTQSALAHKVSWQGKDLSALRGRSIRFRFVLSNAQFYSFRVQ